MGVGLHDFELIIRGIAIGGFLGLALCLARAPAPYIRGSGVLFCLSSAAHVATQSSPARIALEPAFPVLWVLSVMGTAFFWTFANDVFADAERPFWRRYWPAPVLLTLGLAGWFTPMEARPLLWLVHSLFGGLLMAHALLVILAGWRGDLVESRRQLRGPVSAAGALYGVVNAAVQIGEILGQPTAAYLPLAAVVLCLLGLSAIAVFLKTDPALFGGRAKASTTPEVATQDRAALARLKQAMDDEEAWRREALTMFELAKLVGAPEHRLRRLINDALGYRNFAAFLNERRVAAAKEALSSRPETPVSSIAYEVGFASLGPFNRAFKTATGMTPTDFRNAA